MRRDASARFVTVKTQGGLIPAEFLARIADEDTTVPGLLPEHYGLLPHERLTDGAQRAWAYLTGAWQSFQDALRKTQDDDYAVRLTRERWLLPFFRELGYGVLPVTRPVEVEGKTYALSHIWEDRVPVHCMGYRVTLDNRTKNVPGAAKASPHGLVQEFLNRSDDHLWGVVTNGKQLRILRDHHSLTRQAYVEFDLETMFQGELAAEFFLLWRVLHASRSTGEKPADAWLEKWFQQARDEGVRALDKLRDGVADAIAILGSGFLKRSENQSLHQALESGVLDKQDYYRQLLRLVYRLIFLFVAEDRDLLLDPQAADDAKERYRRFYSTARLRKLSERRRSSPYVDLWQALRLVMTKLDEGCPELALPALDSFLWRDASVADLIHAELGNEDLLDAIDAMSHIVEKGVRLPVSWQSIGSEELGSVYESLLEQHPEIHRDTATFELQTAAGHERKTTGSYYTPSSLVDCLLDSALDPVVDEAAAKDDPEKAILDLKVCDPACGSGHFLVAAARRIAKRLANVRSGDEEPSPQELQHALRDVVGRCIYGVDINPMAVELCKVSLWMEALEPGRPLSFLDHHIQCGNSLLGATPALLRKGIPDEAFTPVEGDDPAFCRELKKRNKEERETRQRSLFAEGYDPMQRFGDLRTVIGEIEDIDDSTLAGVRDKERRWYEVRDSRDYLYGRMWTDAWCAAFVWEKVDDPKKPFPITEELFRVMEENPNRVTQDVRAEIRRLAEVYKFLHWHLAFPEVFQVRSDAESDENEIMGWRGGFTTILGNPPWERVKLQEIEFFSTRSSEITAAKNSAARKRIIATLAEKRPSLWAEWAQARREAEATSILIRTGGSYPLCGRGDINTYSIFAELNCALLAVAGAAGFIVPAGIATDATTQYFFKNLVIEKRIASLYHFENEEKIFSALHHAFRFCLLSVRGRRRPVEKPRFVSYARQVDQVTAEERAYTLTAEDFGRLNPNTGTLPLFRLSRDARIAKNIYEEAPVLIIEEATDGNPWRIDFLSMLHMANDSYLFMSQAKLTKAGWVSAGSKFELAEKVALPLYEAKMIHQFDHRFGTYDGQTEAQANQGKLPELTLGQHLDPTLPAYPRYWVDQSEVDGRLAGKWSRGWLLGWRDITGAEKVRTVISALIPRCAVGDKFLLMLPGRHPREVACLCSNLNAFVFDFLSRQKIGGTSLKYFTMRQLPIMTPNRFVDESPFGRGSYRRWIVPRVLELTYTAWDLQPFAQDIGYDGPPFKWNENRRRMLRAELDAAFFHLYGIERDDVDYIMETFPIVKKRDVKQFGDYRTKLMILKVYDEMKKAMETGEPYQTMLDPPPADPRVAHPPRDADAVPEPLRFPVPTPPSEEGTEDEEEWSMVAEEPVEYEPAIGPAPEPEPEAGSEPSPGEAAAMAIVEFLSKRGTWCSRAEVFSEVELTVSEWNRAIGELVTAGEVERQGEKRGARYRYVSAAVAPDEDEPSPSDGVEAEDDEASRSVVEWFAENPGWHARAEVMEALGIDAAAWNHVMEVLVESGEVERKGEKGGTRYRWRGDDRSLVAFWFAERPGWHSRQDVMEDLEIDSGSWNRAIRDLVESGEVVRKGEKRGARYRWWEHEEQLLF